MYGVDFGFPAVLDLETLGGAEGFVLIGVDDDDLSGSSVTNAGDMNGDGIDDFAIAAPGAEPNGPQSGEVYVVFGVPSIAGSVNEANGFLSDVLFVNGSMGGPARTVEASSVAPIVITILKPIAGGNGKFVLHGNVGCPDGFTRRELPFDVGQTGFPFLLSDGASPVIVANSLGASTVVGESQFLGVLTEDPAPAPTEIFYPPLPVGTVITFQAVIRDSGSVSARRASVTNGVIMKVVW